MPKQKRPLKKQVKKLGKLKKCFECKKNKDLSEYVKFYSSGAKNEWNVCVECRKSWVLAKFGRLGSKKPKHNFNKKI